MGTTNRRRGLRPRGTVMRSALRFGSAARSYCRRGSLMRFLISCRKLGIPSQEERSRLIDVGVVATPDEPNGDRGRSFFLGSFVTEVERSFGPVAPRTVRVLEPTRVMQKW